MHWHRLILAAALAGSAAAQQEFDLVVYGGTAGGVMTAVAGARHGMKTVLLEPGTHVGGMVSGGLSGTDVGKIEVIGGMALEFYWRAGRHYGLDRHLQSVAWMPEPGVAEKIMREMLAEAKVTLMERHRLAEGRGVIKQGARVSEIVMENGARFRGQVFADASYEGDLMAQAKIGYTVGRESVKQYGESLAGVRAHTASHQFPVNISAYDENGRLLPEISPEPRGEPGAGDRRVQAYNFRVIGTNVAANRVPWEKPDRYDPKRFELLARYLAEITRYLGRPPVFNEVSLFRIIPNGKADLNNRGPFSTDYIGKSYGYPDGTYAERQRIWDDHVLYQKSFYYFLATDPRVPKSLQDEVNQWGLARDEFADTGHWPNQLYIREARRMVGDFVATQRDLQTERTKPDFIGMGSYNSDSHNVQRHVADGGIVLNEGDVQVPVQPYQIPYRILLPKKSEAVNVLVPVCFSASHIAYSSLRMEPQYMIIGHAAGIAAALAVRSNSSVQDIPLAELQTVLRAEGGVFEQGYDHQQRALAAIRAKFMPARAPGRNPWTRSAPAK
jgi:hypothetical protein